MKTILQHSWHLLRRWGPPLALMALIFFLSSRPKLPGPENPLWNLLVKKGGHFVVFGALAWLYVRALTDERPARARDYWLAWGLTLLYAISDEFHQSFTPGRHPALSDVVIDQLGAATALLIHRWRSRKSAPAAPAP